MQSKVHRYASDAIEVQYDVRRCIHAEACIHRLSAVFDKNKRPWIQPSQSEPDILAETIQHCPSGALHYTRHDGGMAETPADTNRVILAENGPLYVSGRVTITADDGTPILEDTRVALCRCGASQNKPLCDNSHLKIGFEAVSDRTPITEMVLMDESALTIRVTHNGSLHLTGTFSILTADGQTLFHGEEAWLCRCGGSGNKPFCDGTHKRNGFAAD